MTSASHALDFEKAAALRDKLDVLRWLDDRLNTLRTALNHPPFIYPVKGSDHEETWYVINRGMVVAAMPAPRLPDEEQLVRKAIEGSISDKTRFLARMPAQAMDGVHLVSSWFRRRPEERTRIRRIHK
jgi:hypothetical protein